MIFIVCVCTKKYNKEQEIIWVGAANLFHSELYPIFSNNFSRELWSESSTQSTLVSYALPSSIFVWPFKEF